MTIAEWLAEKGRKQGIVQGMEQGEAIGRREEAYKIARNMLSAGLSVTLITQLTGLTADDLETQHD
ncbi:hypothetical protein U0026_17115 [Kluyvera intermedia]|uniref:hypothetical protein n=1 Tax=Kluyvera intermedia TaxID=61648 RepID=UPI0007875F35|nr:hypothetical protein [Kluyvera intermedia]WQD28731.1 hypothetical protein U0026_17115 [Kluyvera intermedia]VDZ84422.1 Uncharacterised protein [Kluyvera intermedia]